MIVDERFDVHDPKTWPIGAPVQFDCKWKNMDGKRHAHFAIGIVIGNARGRIVVVWPQHCAERMSTYSIASLNRALISRPW